VNQHIAIVTGAANGIGWATAMRLRREGFALVLADQDPRLSENVLGTSLEDAATIVGSVADDRLIEDIFDVVDSLPGTLAVLVNNAGVGGPGGEVSKGPRSALQHVLDVNLFAPYLLATRASQPMMSARYGRIINVGSVFGQQAVPEAAPYCISKGAITQLTQSLAVDLGPYNITVNTVAPGFILTDMHMEEIEARAEAWGVTIDEAQRRTAASVPLRRHGEPVDVAAVITWLAGADSSYVTGQTVAVNGGILLS
jgi:NAD(P)-dependent dehydrogenase (short-subunit alcohol dehydrogenase family)